MLLQAYDYLYLNKIKIVLQMGGSDHKQYIKWNRFIRKINKNIAFGITHHW